MAPRVTPLNIAALAAVTWYGETSFSNTPQNNLATGDYGPMQINRATWDHTPADVFGTLGVPTFNGSMSANIAYAEQRFERYYLPYYGAFAAGAYVSASGLGGTEPALNNPLAQRRQQLWGEYSHVLIGYFSQRACFAHR